jgi:hypothetical protein
MDAYLSSRLYVWWTMFEMENRGFDEPGATADNIRDSVDFYFGITFAQDWWKQERETGNWGDALTAMIDKAILTSDSSSIHKR